MRRLASLVAFLLLLTTAFPALACTTSRAMSPDESACCRTMQDTTHDTTRDPGHNRCSQMVKQGCCRMELRSSERPQLVATTRHIDVHLAMLTRLLPVAAFDRTIAQTLQTSTEHGPPGLLNVQTSVLRI